MFSGIVQELGQLESISKSDSILKLNIKTTRNFSNGVNIGDSIAVDGVCLTATKVENQHLSFDAVPETLSRTIMSTYKKESKINLEKSLQYGDVIGGHLNSGHIHCVGVVKEVEIIDAAKDVLIEISNDWGKYIFEKGYISLNGCSITLGAINVERFKVHLIPETLASTNLDLLVHGDRVNIEFDQNTITIVDTTERILSNKL